MRRVASFLVWWSISFAVALGGLALIYADGCQAEGQEPHQVDRLCSNRVPAHTVILPDGRQVPIPEHWHPHWGRCAVCDRAAAAPQQQRTEPAPQAANQASSAESDRYARLAAEVAGLKNVFDRGAADGRKREEQIRRIEQTLTVQARALEGLVPAVEQLQGDVGALDSALERFALSSGRLAEAFEQDRAARGSRKGDDAGSVAAPDSPAGSPWAAAAALAARALAGSSPWVGVGLGGLAVGGWVWSWWRKRRAASQVAASEAAAVGPSSTRPIRDSPASSPSASPPLSPPPPSPPPETRIIYQTPPPPQVVRSETEHHVVEGPNHGEEAWEFAAKEMVQREPSTLPFVNRMRSLKSQWISGQKLKEKQRYE